MFLCKCHTWGKSSRDIDQNILRQSDCRILTNAMTKKPAVLHFDKNLFKLKVDRKT